MGDGFGDGNSVVDGDAISDGDSVGRSAGVKLGVGDGDAVGDDDGVGVGLGWWMRKETHWPRFLNPVSNAAGKSCWSSWHMAMAL